MTYIYSLLGFNVNKNIKTKYENLQVFSEFLVCIGKSLNDVYFIMDAMLEFDIWSTEKLRLLLLI